MPDWETLTVDIGLHGWIALTLAVLGIAGLHFGLMWLARRPWDATYHDDDAPPDSVWTGRRTVGRATDADSGSPQQRDASHKDAWS